MTDSPALETDLENPRLEEELARQALSWHLDGTLVYTDCPDFRLNRNGRQVGCVEVTQATSQEIKTMQGQLKDVGRSYEDPRLKRSWLVVLEKGVNLRAFESEKLATALVARDAIWEVGTQGASRLPSNERGTELKELGVAFAFARSTPEGAARIDLQEPGFSAFIDPETINRIAESTVRRKSTVLQLVNGERHLFVWVDPFEETGAGLALGGSGAHPPDGPPNLPTWLHTVWLMSTYGPPRLWQVDRGSGWRIHEVPEPFPVPPAAR